MALNLIGGYTGAFTKVDRSESYGSELFAVSKTSPPYFGVFAYTGGSVELLQQRNITGTNSVGMAVPMADVYHDGTYVYAAVNYGTPPPSANRLWAYQYTGGTLYTKGSDFAAAQPPESAGCSTIIAAVSGDGTYVYRATYNESGYDSQLTLKALTFNGSTFTNLATVSVVSGSDTGVRSWVYCYGGYIHVAANGTNVKCFKAYTFNGTSFSLAASTTTASSGLDGDGTYIYTVQGNNLIAYSFNGSSYAATGSSYSIGGDVGSIVCSGGMIYVAPIEGTSVLVLSFDGSSFTLENTGTIPTPGYGGPAYFAPGPACLWATSYDNFGTKGGVWAFDFGAVPAPVADFSATPVTGLAPLSIAFTDLSTNTPTTWAWDFGDGYTGSIQNPTHIYTGVGSYTVTLEASNGGGSDTEVKVGYITVTPQKIIPTADATVGVTPFTVSFGIIILSGDWVSFHWDFGDGNSSDTKLPTHVYNTTGWHTVILTAVDSFGNTEVVRKPGFVRVGRISFSATPSESSTVPSDVFFTNTSAAPTGYEFTNWHWDFGDVPIGSGLTGPSHVYSEYGSYNVTLSAKMTQVD